MSLNKTELVKLAKIVANANPSSQVAYSFNDEKFSYADLNETLRSELVELAGTFQLYRENKNTIFALIEETINDVLPKKVMEQYGQFAEVKTFAQGDKPVFKQKISAASRRRAKQFITKVGLAGVYEVFKLDGKSYEVATNAIGGAAQIGFEEFLDGRVDFATVLEIVMEGLDETNSKKVIDPGYAWIIPTGGDKPVKVAFEGDTLVDERKNGDWSREVQVYKKVGVGAVITNNICVYVNSDIAFAD